MRLREWRSARTWAAECHVVPEVSLSRSSRIASAGAHFRQVVEGGAAHDAAADDDDRGVGGKVGHGAGPPGYFWQTGQKKVDRPDRTLRCTVAPLRPQGQGLPSRP